MCLFDSHGQLGHGGLTSEEEPRAVEALWGMTMSCVATGGWHSVCISGKCHYKVVAVKSSRAFNNNNNDDLKSSSPQTAVTFTCGAGMKAVSLDFHHGG